MPREQEDVLIDRYSYGLNQEASKNNNVIDIYKAWTAEEVRADLDTRRTDVVTVLSNTTHDFNAAAAIRSNNAFLGKSVYIVGRRRYDKRGAVGCHKYEHVYHADMLQEVIDRLHEGGYVVYAVDNQMEYHPQNLYDTDFPPKSAFVYGEERRGLAKEEIKSCDGMVYVGMYGSVRSLNVAACAAVVLAEYTRRYRS